MRIWVGKKKKENKRRRRSFKKLVPMKTRKTIEYIAITEVEAGVEVLEEITGVKEMKGPVRWAEAVDRTTTLTSIDNALNSKLKTKSICTQLQHVPSLRKTTSKSLRILSAMKTTIQLYENHENNNKILCSVVFPLGVS